MIKAQKLQASAAGRLNLKARFSISRGAKPALAILLFDLLQ
nr:hypothetical protein [uncultured Campylobacter sp.]